MASITIRRLEEGVKSRLRVRAARHGRSMEEEAREILKAGLAMDAKEGKNFADLIRSRIEPLGGVHLRPARREPVRRPPDFSE